MNKKIIILLFISTSSFLLKGQQTVHEFTSLQFYYNSDPLEGSEVDMLNIFIFNMDSAGSIGWQSPEFNLIVFTKINEMVVPVDNFGNYYVYILKDENGNEYMLTTDELKTNIELSPTGFFIFSYLFYD